jgi:phage protein D
MAMSPKYFAPAFKVEINGAGLAADVSKNITDISVVREPDTLDHFSLTIANPYPKMRWTHTSDADLFKEGNAIKIEMGYVDDLQPMFDGEITSISPSFPESGTPTVRIEGYTRLHWLQGSPKTRTFQDVTDKQIAEKIAQDLGLTPDAEDTKTRHPYVIQYNQTDLAFLIERARRIRFEVLVQEKTLIFRKAQDNQSKTYTLEWGKTLKSFNPTMNTLRQVNEVIVRGYDLMTRQEIVGRAGAGDEDTKMGGRQTGAQVAAQAFGRRIEEVRVETPIASQQEADQLARAIYNDRALQFVTGNGSSIGLPDLRAGRVIELQGLGPRFSGLYYITQSTHTISSGGHQTNFSVRRNAV